MYKKLMALYMILPLLAFISSTILSMMPTQDSLASITEARQLPAIWSEGNEEAIHQFYSQHPQWGMITIKQGNTVLHYAAEKGYTSVCDILLRNKADVHQENHQGDTPLMVAAAYGQCATASRLLLEAAIQKKRIVDIAQSQTGITPLHRAIKEGHLNMMRLLLFGFKASPDKQDKEGRSPLHYAIEGGHTPIVKDLIDYNVDLEVSNSYGLTPLMTAVSLGNRAVVDLLCHHKASLEGKGTSGVTPLIIAAQNGNNELVRLLLLKRASTYPTTFSGMNALMHAAQKGHSFVVTSLLLAQGSPAAKDNEGKTALVHAAENGHEHVVAQLLLSGATDGLDKALQNSQHEGVKNNLVLYLPQIESDKIFTQVVVQGDLAGDMREQAREEMVAIRVDRAKREKVYLKETDGKCLLIINAKKMPVLKDLERDVMQTQEHDEVISIYDSDSVMSNADEECVGAAYMRSTKAKKRRIKEEIRHNCMYSNCNKNYTALAALHEHIQKDHKEGFVCKELECTDSLPFKSRTHFIDHARSCHEGKYIICLQQGCDNRYHSVRGFKVHMRQEHTICSECNFKADSFDEIEKHFTDMHQQQLDEIDRLRHEEAQRMAQKAQERWDNGVAGLLALSGLSQENDSLTSEPEEERSSSPEFVDPALLSDDECDDIESASSITDFMSDN